MTERRAAGALVDVYDADTPRVDFGNGPVRVRLPQVNAAEIDNPYTQRDEGTPQGYLARERARQLVAEGFNQPGPSEGVDFHGRSVRDLYNAQGQSLSEQLVSEGVVPLRDYTGEGVRRFAAGGIAAGLSGEASRGDVTLGDPTATGTIGVRNDPIQYEKTLKDEFQTGLRRGTSQTLAGLSAGVAALGNLFSDSDQGGRPNALERFGDRNFRKWMAEAELDPRSEDFDEVRKGEGSVLRYAAGVIGESIPTMLGIAAGGGAGVAANTIGRVAANGVINVGKRKLTRSYASKLIEEGIPPELARQAATANLSRPLAAVNRALEGAQRFANSVSAKAAGHTGAFTTAALLEGGFQFKDLEAEYGLRSGEQALAIGALAGALEYVGALSLLGKGPFAKIGREGAMSAEAAKELLDRSIVGRSLRNAVVNAPKGIVSEGLTEAAQELLQIAGVEARREDSDVPFIERVFSEENQMRLLESAVAGGIFGGAIRTAGAPLQTISERKQARSVLAEENKDATPQPGDTETPPSQQAAAAPTQAEEVPPDVGGPAGPPAGVAEPVTRVTPEILEAYREANPETRGQSVDRADVLAWANAQQPQTRGDDAQQSGASDAPADTGVAQESLGEPAPVVAEGSVAEPDQVAQVEEPPVVGPDGEPVVQPAPVSNPIGQTEEVDASEPPFQAAEPAQELESSSAEPLPDAQDSPTAPAQTAEQAASAAQPVDVKSMSAKERGALVRAYKAANPNAKNPTPAQLQGWVNAGQVGKAPVQAPPAAETATAASEPDLPPTPPVEAYEPDIAAAEQAAAPTRSYPMNFKMAATENKWGEDTTTLQKIVEGQRTSTTRENWGPNGPPKVGETVRFYGPGPDGKRQQVDVVVTKVTKITPELAKDDAFREQWSQKEGWKLKGQRFLKGYQVEFELASKAGSKAKAAPGGKPLPPAQQAFTDYARRTFEAQQQPDKREFLKLARQAIDLPGGKELLDLADLDPDLKIEIADLSEISEDGKRTYGTYSADLHRIIISSRVFDPTFQSKMIAAAKKRGDPGLVERASSPDFPARILVHEVAHAMTVRRLRRNAGFRQKAVRLMNHAKGAIGEARLAKSARLRKAMQSELEFVAELFASPELQNVLRELPAVKSLPGYTEGTKKTLLRQVVDVIRRALGLSEKAGNLLEQSLNFVATIPEYSALRDAVLAQEAEQTGQTSDVRQAEEIVAQYRAENPEMTDEQFDKERRKAYRQLIDLENDETADVNDARYLSELSPLAQRLRFLAPKLAEAERAADAGSSLAASDVRSTSAAKQESDEVGGSEAYDNGVSPQHNLIEARARLMFSISPKKSGEKTVSDGAVGYNFGDKKDSAEDIAAIESLQRQYKALAKELREIRIDPKTIEPLSTETGDVVLDELRRRANDRLPTEGEPTTRPAWFVRRTVSRITLDENAPIPNTINDDIPVRLLSTGNQNRIEAYLYAWRKTHGEGAVEPTIYLEFTQRRGESGYTLSVVEPPVEALGTTYVVDGQKVTRVEAVMRYFRQAWQTANTLKSMAKKGNKDVSLDEIMRVAIPPQVAKYLGIGQKQTAALDDAGNQLFDIKAETVRKLGQLMIEQDQLVDGHLKNKPAYQMYYGLLALQNDLGVPAHYLPTQEGGFGDAGAKIIAGRGETALTADAALEPESAKLVAAIEREANRAMEDAAVDTNLQSQLNTLRKAQHALVPEGKPIPTGALEQRVEELSKQLKKTKGEAWAAVAAQLRKAQFQLKVAETTNQVLRAVTPKLVAKAAADKVRRDLNLARAEAAVAGAKRQTQEIEELLDALEQWDGAEGNPFSLFPQYQSLEALLNSEVSEVLMQSLGEINGSSGPVSLGYVGAFTGSNVPEAAALEDVASEQEKFNRDVAEGNEDTRIPDQRIDESGSDRAVFDEFRPQNIYGPAEPASPVAQALARAATSASNASPRGDGVVYAARSETSVDVAERRKTVDAAERKLRELEAKRDDLTLTATGSRNRPQIIQYQKDVDEAAQADATLKYMHLRAGDINARVHRAVQANRKASTPETQAEIRAARLAQAEHNRTLAQVKELADTLESRKQRLDNAIKRSGALTEARAAAGFQLLEMSPQIDAARDALAKARAALTRAEKAAAVQSPAQQMLQGLFRTFGVTDHSAVVYRKNHFEEVARRITENIKQLQALREAWASREPAALKPMRFLLDDPVKKELEAARAGQRPVSLKTTKLQLQLLDDAIAQAQSTVTAIREKLKSDTAFVVQSGATFHVYIPDTDNWEGDVLHEFGHVLFRAKYRAITQSKAGLEFEKAAVAEFERQVDAGLETRGQDKDEAYEEWFVDTFVAWADKLAGDTTFGKLLDGNKEFTAEARKAKNWKSTPVALKPLFIRLLESVKEFIQKIVGGPKQLTPRQRFDAFFNALKLRAFTQQDEALRKADVWRKAVEQGGDNAYISELIALSDAIGRVDARNMIGKNPVLRSAPRNLGNAVGSLRDSVRDSYHRHSKQRLGEDLAQRTTASVAGVWDVFMRGLQSTTNYLRRVGADDIADLIAPKVREGGSNDAYIPSLERETSRLIRQGMNVFRRYQTANKLSDAQMQEAKQKAYLELVGEDVETANLSPLAKQFRAFLRETVVPYLTSAPIGDGERAFLEKNEKYFWRLWDFDAVAKDSDKLVMILSDPASWKDPKKAMTEGEAKRWVEDMKSTNGAFEPSIEIDLASENEYSNNVVSPRARALMERQFDQLKSRAVIDFLHKEDFEAQLGRYVKDVAHSVEFDRFFSETTQLESGDTVRLRGQKLKRLVAHHRQRWEKGEITLPQFRHIQYILRGITGQLQIQMNPGVMKFQGWVRTALDILLLPLAMLSSIPEPANILMRSNSNWSATWKGAQEAFKKMHEKSDTALWQFAESIGAVQSQMLDQAVQDRMDLRWMTDGQHKVSAKFFRMIGLTQWTQKMRLWATATAHAALVDGVRKGGDAEFKKFVSELGMDYADVEAWVKEGAQLDPDWTPDSRNGRVAAGIQRFVQESIFAPNKGLKPAFANDPRFALISHLKSFMFGFYNTIIKGLFKQLGDSKNFKEVMVVMLPLIPLFMLGAMSMWMRDMLKYGGGTVIPWRDPGGKPAYLEPTPGDYIMQVISRTGMLGPFDLVLSAMRSEEYGGSAIFGAMGPLFSTFDSMRIADGANRYLKVVPGMSVLTSERLATAREVDAWWKEMTKD